MSDKRERAARKARSRKPAGRIGLWLRWRMVEGNSEEKDEETGARSKAPTMKMSTSWESESRHSVSLILDLDVNSIEAFGDK